MTRPNPLAILLGLLALCGTLSCGAEDLPHPREVQNLRTFAKLYGYVRFFHPSDQAREIDWDRFAIVGASLIHEASNRDELRQTLDELFLPIAPTVQIYPSGGDSPGPADLAPEDTSKMKIIAWQHKGVSLGPQSIYLSARTNRPRELLQASQGFGTVTQSVDATELRGKEIRMRAAIRAEVEGSKGRGQLWLRVDRPNRQTGFFDNMQDRPVTSSEWATYEIAGEVADDAEHVFFGCFLGGAGKVWVDDVSLWIRRPGTEWQQVAISNPGFENGDEAVGWSTASRGYEYDVEPVEAYQGERSLRIEALGRLVPDKLFEKVPEAGQTVDKDLGSGLMARIPVALYSDANGTIGVREASPLDTLLAKLDAIDVQQMSASDLSLRLGGVVIAWNVFQHFYPYFDVVSADWDAVLSETLVSALDDIDRKDYMETLQRMVAQLEDGHGRVFHPLVLSDRAFAPIAVEWIEDRVVVTHATGTVSVQPGDIVLALNGRPAREIVEEIESLISGSPQWKRTRCMDEFFLGEKGSEAKLTIERDGELSPVQVIVVRSRERPLAPREGPTVEELGGGIMYVDLTRAQMAEITPRIEELAGAPGVVFDLRGYPQGNHVVLQYLTDEPLQSAHWMVPQIVYPDREDLVGYDRSGRWTMKPLKPRFAGTIVFLTNGRAISYAESVMGIVEAYRLGEIVGQPTAGTNGNVNSFTLPGGYRMTWTGMRVEKHDGSQHHLVGIRPTVPVERTIEGVSEGRDEHLEAALEIIRKSL